MTEIGTPTLLRALEFYSQSPDGQYDLSVVVPLLEQELATRPMTASEVFYRNPRAGRERL